ncbi:hypothetical protein [Cumulibacter soli]|uniref:hypothetical protein n=1 Tax=Cumulibacter soli TaxID=2546344 RepID=UPI0010679544|nr:hypothetical protein [Cumulibacter soli]
MPYAPPFVVYAAQVDPPLKQELHIWNQDYQTESLQYVMMATGPRTGLPVTIQTATRPIVGTPGAYKGLPVNGTPEQIAYEDAASIAEGVLHARIPEMDIQEIGTLLPRPYVEEPPNPPDTIAIGVDGIQVRFAYARKSSGWAAVGRLKESFISIASSSVEIEDVYVTHIEPTSLPYRSYDT